MRRHVLVFDPRKLHRESLNRVLLNCGAKAVWTQDLNDTSAMQSCCRVVLADLERIETLDPSSVAQPQSLRRNGSSVLAFADGAAQWSVRKRCLAFLAGASQVLDSGRPEFQRDLKRWLGECLQAEAEREGLDQQIKDTMAGLGVVGASRAIIEACRTIVRISALSDLPTLLTGETGTGKELFAHALHALDPKRRTGPFIALNCASLPPTLAESELFGCRRGAFTGAERDRRGLIRAAQGGVLFLDEIGELALALQAKLLRVLQEHRVLSVGDEHEVPVNVRVVAATNRDLLGQVKLGRFRPDLLHRLSVVSVRVPTLGERSEDIEPLTHYFVAKHAGQGRNGRLSVAPDFIEALRQVELPGNVRQLENIIRQALLNKRDTDRTLGLSDLPAEIWEQVCEPDAMSHSKTSPSPDQPQPTPASLGLSGSHHNGDYWEHLLETHGGNLARCLAACEKDLVASALRRTRGNQTQAARFLGITPRSVYNKLHRHLPQG